MTEIDVLKYDLAQERKAFDKLHKQHIQLIHKQSELEEENEQLKSEIKDLKFENEKKYREIKQLEQMLQDVER